METGTRAIRRWFRTTSLMFLLLGIGFLIFGFLRLTDNLHAGKIAQKSGSTILYFIVGTLAILSAAFSAAIGVFVERQHLKYIQRFDE
jgi:hypothetical protein